MKIAAIQMVSAPDLATNLATATSELVADLAGVSANQSGNLAAVWLSRGCKFGTVLLG